MTNHKGRKRGAVSPDTKTARALYVKVIEGEAEYIDKALQELREESSYKYLNVLAKLMGYVLPRMTESNVTTTDTYTSMINLGEGVKPFDIKDLITFTKPTEDARDN